MIGLGFQRLWVFALIILASLNSLMVYCLDFILVGHLRLPLALSCIVLLAIYTPQGELSEWSRVLHYVYE